MRIMIQLLLLFQLCHLFQLTSLLRLSSNCSSNRCLIRHGLLSKKRHRWVATARAVLAARPCLTRPAGTTMSTVGVGHCCHCDCGGRSGNGRSYDHYDSDGLGDHGVTAVTAVQRPR